VLVRAVEEVGDRAFSHVRSRPLFSPGYMPIRELLAHVLYAERYVVDVASTIADAWRHLNTRRYALVIVDLRLPDGDGFEIADAAAQIGAKTLVMSGYLFQMSDGRADQHKILMKPIRPSELIAAVERTIGGGSTVACDEAG
jgi:DNA-binding response OmpR family regulator